MGINKLHDLPDFSVFFMRTGDTNIYHSIDTIEHELIVFLLSDNGDHLLRMINHILEYTGIEERDVIVIGFPPTLGEVVLERTLFQKFIHGFLQFFLQKSFP